MITHYVIALRNVQKIKLSIICARKFWWFASVYRFFWEMFVKYLSVKKKSHIFTCWNNLMIFRIKNRQREEKATGHCTQATMPCNQPQLLRTKNSKSKGQPKTQKKMFRTLGESWGQITSFPNLIMFRGTYYKKHVSCKF